LKVFFTAAHGGFHAERVPLGGGAAVCDLLCAEWNRTRPFPFTLFQAKDVRGADIIGFDTASYARFARSFGEASTKAIEREDPATTAVLINDIAEGPDFRRLQRLGYRLVTLWHVDVVAYVAAIYLGGWILPEMLTALHRVIGGIYPPILRLIFEKQKDCVECSEAHVVPSPEMKSVILRCYPDTSPDRIHVIPWGAPSDEGSHPSATRAEARRELGLPADALILLTLSRLSPEKNQQRLLEALAEWERRPDYPSHPVYAILCGGAAYMHGRKHEEKLRRIAATLRRTTVLFPGFVYGQRKRRFFESADLYVFPSRHESYGLTLMEAFEHGLPALTLDHAGARAVMRPEFGAMATEATFAAELRRLSAEDLAQKGEAARAFALMNPFREAAHRLSTLLRSTIR
jgi:glycosyltransferase involved in cell wall biosynthesis